MNAEIVTTIVSVIWNVLVFLAPVWAPVVLFILASRLWMHYVRQRFISGMEWALLEIRVPREVQKSPLAMELILSNALYQVSEKGWMERWVKGEIRFWYSLEIVSIDGNIHFFIWTPTRTKNLVESQIYAQYPQAEVFEVEDYTNYVPYSVRNSDWKLWGTEFKKEHDEFYPIKTYPLYDLDKAATDEEEKVDPITPALELMGSLKQGEQMWVQILIQGTGFEHKRWGTWRNRRNWQEEVEERINKLLEPYTEPKEEGKFPSAIMPEHVKKRVEALARTREKLGFDCGIRCIYIAKKDAYDSNNAKAMRLIFRQYASFNLNSFERRSPTAGAAPWHDPTGDFQEWKKDEMLKLYRTREYFYPQLQRSEKMPWPISKFYKPLRPIPFFMNSEEIATIFHFPGRVAETPTLRRVESRTAEPPSNLPV